MEGCGINRVSLANPGANGVMNVNGDLNVAEARREEQVVCTRGPQGDSYGGSKARYTGQIASDNARERVPVFLVQRASALGASPAFLHFTLRENRM